MITASAVAEVNQILQSNSGRLILLDFYGAWCRPCVDALPLLDQLATEYAADAVVVKVDTDASTDLAPAFGVESLPSFLFYRDGAQIDKFIGSSNSMLKEKFLSHVKGIPITEAFSGGINQDATEVPTAEEDAPSRKRPRLENGEAHEAAQVADADDLLLALDAEDDRAPAESAMNMPIDSTEAVPDPYAFVTWSDIFGDIPRSNVEELLISDNQDQAWFFPEMLDTYGAIQACFGERIAESDVAVGNPLDYLRKAVTEVDTQRHVEAADECFGEKCRRTLLATAKAKFVPFTLRFAHRPKNPLLNNPLKEKLLQGRYLMQMPKIEPNTQTLHLETERYYPQELRVPETDARNIYTPHNVVRWNYHPAIGHLSNARMVQWSDGSLTLHVSSDVYEVFDSSDRSLHFVSGAEPQKDWSGSIEVESVPIDRHVLVRAAASIANSVEAVIQASSNAERAIELQSRLPVPINALPDFNVEKDKKQPKNLTLTLEEEFVRQRRAERARLPNATMTDYMLHDAETLRLLQAAKQEARMEQLVQQGREQIQAAKRGGAAGGGRGRDVDLAYEAMAEQYRDGSTHSNGDAADNRFMAGEEMPT